MFYFILLLGVFSQIVHTEEKSNSFVLWAKQYAQEARQEGGWVCGLLPASRLSGFPWLVSPLQGSDWSGLQHYIHEEQAESVQLRTATLSNISEWPAHLALESEGHGKNFSKNVTDAVIQKFSESFLSRNGSRPVPRRVVHGFKGGHFQIWDEYLWLTAISGHLSHAAPLCWEQHKHSRSDWPGTSKFLGWIPRKQCQRTILLEKTDWFATDWSSRPDVRWAAPNGTQWFCGAHIWPWLPPGWIGRCTLGFPWIQGRWVETLGQPGNLSVSQHRRIPHESHPHPGQSSHAFPSVGLKDVALQVDILSHYLDTALNDTGKEISLSNFETHLMNKAELQQEMAHDTLKAAKHGSCAVLPGECCVYIPKHSGHEHVTPGLITFAPTIQALHSETSRWKWLIDLIGVIVFLLAGLCLVKYVPKFISCNLASSHVSDRFLVLFERVRNFRPPATNPDPDCQEEEHGVELASLVGLDEEENDTVALLSSEV